MLLIYCHQITNRVRYTFSLLLTSVLGIDFEITSDRTEFTRSAQPKISYTTKPIGDELFFESSELLFETCIRPIQELPKDSFALAFFLSSRYEEYLPFEPDRHGRFSARLSVAHKSNVLQRPLVNIHAERIRERIRSRYPDLSFPLRKYSYVPTIDIDTAYAYRGQGALRTLYGYTSALLRADWDDLKRRKKVLSNNEPGQKETDPYDTYEFQYLLHQKYRVNPVYFFLLGDYGPNDQNLPHNNPLMQALVKRISQHYELIASGITDDYTMGFADEIGFRAGICTPYKWYDLEREQGTDLVIHPFSVMDGTLHDYMKRSPEQAIEDAQQIINEITKVNGEFITIWHNSTLSDWRGWEGWKGVYERVIQCAIAD